MKKNSLYFEEISLSLQPEFLERGSLNSSMRSSDEDDYAIGNLVFTKFAFTPNRIRMLAKVTWEAT